tara:strand:+ start:14439 stop:19022 length:4584 start_codon:yes stop_codon:yes gene_type:complete
MTINGKVYSAQDSLPAGAGSYVHAYTYYDDGVTVAHTILAEIPNSSDYNDGPDVSDMPYAKIWLSREGCKSTAGNWNECEGTIRGPVWAEVRSPLIKYISADHWAEKLRDSIGNKDSVSGVTVYVSNLAVTGIWNPLEWLNQYGGNTWGAWVNPFCPAFNFRICDGKETLTAVQWLMLLRAFRVGAEDYRDWEHTYGSDARRAIEARVEAGTGSDFPDCNCDPMSDTEETANIEQFDPTWAGLTATANNLLIEFRRAPQVRAGFEEFKPHGTYKVSDSIQTDDTYDPAAPRFEYGIGSSTLIRTQASLHAIQELGSDEAAMNFSLGNYPRTLKGTFSWAPVYIVESTIGRYETGTGAPGADRQAVGVEGGSDGTFVTNEPWPSYLRIDHTQGNNGLLDWMDDGALRDFLIVGEKDNASKEAFLTEGGSDAERQAASIARSQFADLLYFYYYTAMTYKDYMVAYKATSPGTQIEAQADILIAALEGYLLAIENMSEVVEKQMCYICYTHAVEYWYAEGDDAYASMRSGFPGYLATSRAASRTDFAARAEARRAAADRLRAVDGRDIEVPPFFREQCFLLAQMPFFAEWKRQVIEREEPKRLPYIWTPARDAGGDREDSRSANSNACLQMDGEPFGFMNKLTQYPSYSNIANMKTSEIANLQPLIRIFKILIDEDGLEKQMEIPFESHFTWDDFDLFRDNKNRGQGVGIKDFTFSFEADNPFALKKSIKARLTMFANSFSELLRSRSLEIDDPEARHGYHTEEFKYVDLALKTGTGKSFSVGTLDPNRADVVVANLDKLNFRIKAVVGWNYRQGWGSVSNGAFQLGPDAAQHTISDGVRAALYDSYITLNLTPVIHEFDIDDQGRVVFKIDYLAYVEDFFDQPAFNIFPNVAVDPSLLPGSRHSMELSTETARVMRDIKSQTFASECDSDQMSGLKEELATEVEIYRIESMKALMEEMMARKKIRYVNLTSNDVYSFRRSGPNWDGIEDALNGTNLAAVGITGGGIQTYLTGSSPVAVKAETISQIEGLGLEEADKNRRLRALASTGADTKVQPVSFFYISDLLDVVLKTMDDKYSESFDHSILHDLEALKTEEPSAQYDFSEGNKMRDVLDAKIIRFKQMDTQFKKLRILLGPMELVHQGNFISEFYSIGDVPVAVKYFVEWLSKKMSDRDEVYYTLPKFVNELVNDLCRDILNDSRCFRNQAKQRIRMNQAAVSSYKLDVSEKFPVLERTFREDIGSVVEPSGEITGDFVDEITADTLMFRMDSSRPYHGRMNINDYGAGDIYFPRPALNIAGNRGNPISDDGIDREVNWLVYYAGRTQPVEKMKGIENEDAEYGIFHYTIGQDRGITKQINLKKTDTTGLKELRFEQEGYDGLKQLREVFDVTIKTYANVQAFPGLYIYVDPIGFSPNSSIGSDIIDLTQIGIGGYHMIVRSEHSFGPGYADSKIEAKWVASTHALVTQDQPGQDSSEDSSSQIGEERYCFAAGQRANQRQNAAEQEREADVQSQIDAASSAGPSWWNPFSLYGGI